jgi:hypothetical protein
MNAITTSLPIKKKLIRRPLWKMKSVADFLDLDYGRVMEKIQSGELPFAFDISARKSRSEPRVLAHCVVEMKMGAIPSIGATRNLTMEKVINLILPDRAIRSTELKRLLGCGSDHVYKLAKNFSVARKPAANDGPNSYTVFHRASVEKFLSSRRIV